MKRENIAQLHMDIDHLHAICKNVELAHRNQQCG